MKPWSVPTWEATDDLRWGDGHFVINMVVDRESNRLVIVDREDGSLFTNNLSAGLISEFGTNNLQFGRESASVNYHRVVVECVSIPQQGKVPFGRLGSFYSRFITVYICREIPIPLI